MPSNNSHMRFYSIFNKVVGSDNNIKNLKATPPLCTGLLAPTPVVRPITPAPAELY